MRTGPVRSRPGRRPQSERHPSPERNEGGGAAGPGSEEGTEPGHAGEGVTADAGTATVWGAFAIAGLMVVAGLVWLVGHVAVVRQQVANAADLAALAAAGRVDRSASEACRFAETVTDRMHVELADCRVAHPDALVVVDKAGGPWLAPFGPVTARARAGPVTAIDGGPTGETAATDGHHADEQRSSARDERYARSAHRPDSAQGSPFRTAPPRRE
ncbi:helicase/secretion neighborhood TadE-like protein [Prauserella aidingensis]|uniref:Rv3654c family TadE-like protein n=1 Tax=Prauserella aidingensis TaxID=387890 RepID=UPI0020A45A3D|nr:Rv3654c family TadE-like protein [Prauserella aidingensis]MCP2251810.1 helicase/secretion neighborhood TadE-like protein [Prauserella aidingensis]